MNSEYGQRLSLQELKQRNTQQAVLPTLTTPHEACPSKADWERMMKYMDALWYHADRQTDLLESVSRQMSQLPTRTQLDDLLKAVRHLEQMTEQAGKPKENSFSLHRIRLPRLHLPHVSIPALISLLMAVAALLRELLFKTRRYRDDKLAGKNPPFDMKLEAMLPVINGEIPLKCHAHRADDILTAVRIAKEFGVKATLDHCTDGELISDELAKEGLPVFVGPTLGSKSKAELRHKSFTTPGALYHAGLTVSIITDAPVIPLEKLPMCAGLAANAGLPMEEAWRAITINPARSLGIDSRVGSLEPGKDADLVLWTADPLTTIGAEAYCTIVDGKVVYQAE